MPRLLLRHSELSLEGLAALGPRTACDREPIHRSGAIQPHGYLLVVDAEASRVLAASANFVERHARGEELLRGSLSEVVGERVAEYARSPSAAAQCPSEMLPVAVRGLGLLDDDGEFELVSHRRGDHTILELEPAEGEPSGLIFLQRQHAVGKALHGVDGVGPLCQLAVDELRRLSGFDRVMVYRFDPDAHGRVVAEARAADAEPFFGLQYPASDIPRQARLLYLRNWIRVIPDTAYTPSPLLVAHGADAAAQIDLGMSVLRSVSPYHTRYLANMGVRATMTISLIVENQLWGLIVCHNNSAKRIGHMQRLAFELIGQQLSMRLRAAEIANVQDRTQRFGRLSSQVIGAMAAAEFAAEGARAAHSALLGMVEADGAVLCIDGRQVVVGETPPPGALAPLIAELAARSGADSKPWCTDRLPLLAELPFGSDPGFVAATGAMFQPLPGYAENYVLWLRGERAATVRWAGRTEAPPDEALTPLQPRASFAEWLEEVRGRSVPWRAEELEIAAEFAQCVPELLVNRAQNRLMRLALHDPLTGLPNRLYLIDRLEQMSGAAESAAVFFVDLDGFKKVNDSFGHAAGDELLTMVARRLARLLRPCDFVARIGGDEFVAVAIGLSAPDAAAVGQRVVDAFREPMELQGRVERFVSLSVGVALLDAGTTPNEALRRADSAMYKAKRGGRDRLAVFDAMQLAVVDPRRAEIEELKTAIARDGIAPFYQPVFDISAETPRLHGFEALARWRHPERGLLPPSAFLPIVEEGGLIVAMGWSILTQAVRALEGWPNRALSVAVNLSVAQLAGRRFAEDVLTLLADRGLDPGRLILEVTESAMMQTAELSLRALNTLNDAGVRIAIDDFGTGFCSLTYVRDLPADILKIDRSFVAGLPRNRKDVALVKATVALAKELDIKTVAEGVETAEQLAFLREAGCEFAQGYWLGRPAPPESIAGWIGA